MDNPRFMADQNVGKLGRWLRLLGFDAVLFTGCDDRDMIRKALAEGRIILTRDTHIAHHRVAQSGHLRVITLITDRPDEQLRQVVGSLCLKDSFRPFTLCLECNRPLEERTKEEVRERVPPYVFKTQEQYMECPQCHRLYWRGTHWQAMRQWLVELAGC